MGERREAAGFARLWKTDSGYVPLGPGIWILVGTSDSQIGPRGIHARDRIAQVVVLDQRSPLQFLQLFVFENLPPFEIRQRRWIGPNGRGRTERIGSLYRGPMIVRTHGAASEQNRDHAKGDGRFAHRSVSVCGFRYSSRRVFLAGA